MPQHVCSPGSSTASPFRSSTWIAATPAVGRLKLTVHVAKSATEPRSPASGRGS